MDTLQGFLQTDNPQEQLIEYIKNIEKKTDAQNEIIEEQDERLDRKDEIIEEQDEMIELLKETIDKYEQFQEDVEEHQNELIEHVRNEIDKDDLSESDKERLEELENEFLNYRTTNEKDKAQIRSAVHDADQQAENNVSVIDKVNQKVDTVMSKLKRINGGRNSLEQIVRLPDEIAQETLSKNQLRARSIVCNITDVDWDTAMKGKVIKSRAVRDKLRETYSNAHHQTVSRVMEFINEMGGEHVTMKQRNGRNGTV